MKGICALFLMVVAIINLFGVMLGYPASEVKIQIIFSFNTTVAIITIFTLVFERRK